MRYPSVKSILPICDKTAAPDACARIIRSLIDGTMYPDDVSYAVREWTRQCYNQPRLHERVMCAINDILKAHGVEAIHTRLGIAEYVNFGDTYDTTIMYFQGRYFVSSCGDFIETQERQGNRSNQQPTTN